MTVHNQLNRLASETSPYLLQHAHNPVDWFPWGDEALARARAERKPILLSIGYAACHWCHVMERESFEDPEIARLMNENFINIKVDREERPDLDQIYMNAVQMMTGQGGWPMTVFLTPECVPFYGGTYFPPEDRYNMPAFRRVLQGVAEAYRDRPGEVRETAAAVLSHLNQVESHRDPREANLDPALLKAAADSILRYRDPKNGGFGTAPKFPAPMNLEFLLRMHYRTGDSSLLEVVEHSCRSMAAGGIYDQIGGGFHRYSTDAKWLVPHFEKMLYDNALLSRLYLHVFQVTRNNLYRNVVVETLDYVLREMTDPDGGFYSTQDADSEGVEGKFFVWTIDEVKEVMGADQAAPFCAVYGVTERGNFEGTNILHLARSPSEVASACQIPPNDMDALLGAGRSRLLARRESRVKPARDEKILTSWNGLMMASFAEAGAVLARPDYVGAAVRNAEFLLSNMLGTGGLKHVYANGTAKIEGFLDDYAYMVEGLVVLYETTGRVGFLKSAISLAEVMVNEFWDDKNGGFFYTGTSNEELIARHKDFFDNATPSGSSVAAEALLRLAILTGNRSYERLAVTIFRLLSEPIQRYPMGFGRALGALDFHLSPKQEIALVGTPGAMDTQGLFAEVLSRYLPNVVLVQTDAADDDAVAIVPLLRDRPLVNGQATAYVCENYTCQHPVNSPADLALQLAKPEARPADSSASA